MSQNSPSDFPPKDSRPETSEFYCWQHADAPFRIHLYWDIVERIGRQIASAPSPDAKRAWEVGGVLLGGRNPGGAVEIRDCEPLPCEHHRGPSYSLSDLEKQKLEQVISKYRSPAPNQFSVVGFYRSHTRGILFLDQEDEALIRAYFMDPHDVFLLISPSSILAASASFYFWYQGRIKPEFSFQEFPFERPSGSRSAKAKPVAQPALPPKTAAQVEEIPPFVLPSRSPRPGAPTDFQPVSEPNLQQPDQGKPVAQPALPSKTAARVEEIPPFVLPSRSPRPEAPANVQLVSERNLQQPKAEALPTTLLFQSLTPPPRRRRIWLPLSAAGIAAITLSGFLILKKSTGPADRPLSLQVERTSKELKLTWDRNASAFHATNGAVLSVRDGEYQKDMYLDIVQLRAGSFIYSPLTKDVQFRLEVFTAGEQRISESVMVLGAQSPQPTLKPSPFGTEQPEQPVPQGPLPTVAAAPSNASTSQQPVVSSEMLSRRAPLPLAAGAQRELTVSAIHIPSTSGPELVPPSPTTPSSSNDGTSGYIGPRPIYQAQPTVPTSVGSMITGDIEVDVRVSIDSAGKVVSAHPVSSRGQPNGLVFGLALNAARRWRFEPARNGNQAVSSQTTLRFRFGVKK